MPLPSADHVRSRLYYDPETGIFVWKRVPETDRHDKKWNSRYAGKAAGCIAKQGTKGSLYCVIRMDNAMHRAHRLAWLMMTGNWPVGEIDHIDLDGLNNKFINLREASHSQNLHNIRPHVRNTSGYKGVSLNKRKGKWIASIMLDRKSHFLGYFTTREEAAEAYRQAAIELHGEFARFE